MMKKIIFSLITLSALASDLVYADGSSLWIQNIQKTISAIRVSTKQTSLTADKVVADKTAAWQAYASAAVDRFNRTQVRKIWEQYGPESQLSDPCYQVSIANTANTIYEKVGQSVKTSMESVYRVSDFKDVSVGGLLGWLGQTKKTSSFPYAASVTQKNYRHKTRYCTTSEAANGFCTLQANGMQGGDSDFSMHLSPGSTFGFDQAEAVNDFVKNAAPVRPMVKAGECSTPECLSAFRNRRKEEAYLSMARYSFLRFAESRKTQATGEAVVSDQ